MYFLSLSIYGITSWVLRLCGGLVGVVEDPAVLMMVPLPVAALIRVVSVRIARVGPPPPLMVLALIRHGCGSSW